MSALGLSSQSEFADLGDKLKTYDGAELFVLDQLAPITNGVSDFLYPTVFLAFAIVGLMWWSMRLSPARGVRYLLSVAFVSVLMLPVQIGNAQVPASLYWFNFLTSQALGALQAVVDGTLRGPGGPGNYASALHSLSTFSAGAGGSDLRGTELARAVEAYNTTCKLVGVEVGLTQAEMQAVGLAGGALGVDISGTEKLRAEAIGKMVGKGPGMQQQGERFYIPSRTWWVAREQGQKNLVPTYLKNDDPALRYKSISDTPPAKADMDPNEFWAHDCAELWKIADRSVREYQFSTEVRAKTAALRAGITSSEDISGIVLLGAQLTAAHQVHAATGKEEKKPAGIGASIVGWFVDAIETLVATTAMKLVNWFSELITKWFVFAVPAVAALGIGLMFVIWPVVVLMALIPGRERSIGEFLYYVVFIKLFLFFSYLILKVGGALFLSAVDGFARDGTASLASMTFISGLVIMIGVLWGAPRAASAVTFSQSGGLAGAMGLGAIGGMQIANAARMITTRGVNLIPGARSPGAPGGNLKPSTGRGAMPQAPARGAPSGTASGTLKGMRDKIGGGKK